MFYSRLGLFVSCHFLLFAIRESPIIFLIQGPIIILLFPLCFSYNARKSCQAKRALISVVFSDKTLAPGATQELKRGRYLVDCLSSRKAGSERNTLKNVGKTRKLRRWLILDWRFGMSGDALEQSP